MKTRGRRDGVNQIFNCKRDTIVTRRGKIGSIKLSIFKMLNDPT